VLVDGLDHPGLGDDAVDVAAEEVLGAHGVLVGARMDRISAV
jgi:hypothetical protein